MSGDPADERLMTGYPGRVLVLVAGASMTLFAGQLVLSPLLPAVIDALSISPARAGIALSVMWASVALCRFPGGRLADGLSRKTVLVASFAAAIAGFVLFGAATSYPLLLVGAACVGVGAGLYMPAALALLSETFVARRARAFGVHEVAINLGGVSAGALAVAVLAVGPWNAAFLPVVLALGVVLVLAHRWTDEPYVVSRVGLDLRGAGARLLGDRRVLAMFAAYALVAFTWQGMASFLPTFLQVEKGFAPALASNAFTGMFVVGMATNLFVTPLGDRVGYLRMAAVAAAASTLGLGVVVAAAPAPLVLSGIGLFALGNASFWPLMTASLMGVLPDGSLGGDYGAISTAFMTVGSVGPTYVGVVAEARSYTVAFAGLVVCLLAGVAVSLWLARTRHSS